jgi:hypothetical protein
MGQSGTYYVVHTNITAVKYLQDGVSRFVTIPPGAVIAVQSVKAFGVMEVVYEGETLAVFSRDIAERANEKA